MTESDQVKWRGIQNVSPLVNIQTHIGIFETSVDGVARTQIIKSNEVNNTTTILHTVTAGKTLYLCSCSLHVNAGANQLGHLKVRNVADADQYFLLDLETAAQAPMQGQNTFAPPIAIAAGFDIVVETTAAQAAGFIFGWEQ